MQTALHRKDGLASEETPAMPNLMSSIDKRNILQGEHLVVNFKGQLTPQGKNGVGPSSQGVYISPGSQHLTRNGLCCHLE